MSGPRLKAWHYALGFSSLIPLLGLPSALFSIVVGLQFIRQKGWRLVLMAFCGLALTGWYSRSFLAENNGVDKSSADQVLAIQQNLHRLVQDLENYRTKTGRLPGTLADLSKTTSTKIDDIPSGKSQETRPFFYAAMPDERSYFLFSRGPDGEAFTADDILPILTNEEKIAWGYRVRPLDFSMYQKSPLPQSQSDAAAQPSDTVRWRDPEEGMAEAKRIGRPLLLDFTAEWCGWCRRLENDVLTKPEVAHYINQHYVPVKVMDRMREEHKNSTLVSELQAKFAVRGFPTLAVTSLDYQRADVQRGYFGDPHVTLSFLSRFSDR